MKQQIIKRIRRPSPDPKKILRLNRSEYGDNSFINKKKTDNKFFYPDTVKLINKISKFERVKDNELNIALGTESLFKDILLWHQKQNKKRICFNTPNYFIYEIFSDLFNYKKFKFEIDPEFPVKTDSSKIIDKLKKNKASLFILVNPSSPIEKYWVKKEVIKILNFCKKKNIIVLLDEIYFGLGSKTFKNLIKNYNNLIILRSFSKSFGLPGIRVAYSICNKSLNEKISSYRLALELPTESIDAAIDAIDNFKYKTKRRINNIIAAREYAKKQFLKRNIKCFGNYSNSICIKLENSKQVKIIGDFLKKNKIFVNYSYPNNFSNIINITTTNIGNLRYFFKILDKFFKKNYVYK